MKWDRVMKVACVGFLLGAIGAYVVQPLLHWNDWTHLGDVMLWLVQTTVAFTCAVFWMVAAWPQVRPTFRRWLGFGEDAR
jgi:hypothetical protein